MRVEDLVGDKESVILAALTHPGLAPHRKPTIELVQKAIIGEIERRALQNVRDQVTPVLEAMYQRYVIINGEFEDILAEDVEDYTTGLDDELEKALEPWTPWLSANWLGVYTIGWARFWEDDNPIGKYANLVAKEVFKQLTYGKTPAQTLSNAGIVNADIEIYFGQHMAGTLPAEAQEEQKQMSEASLESIVVKMRTALGDAYDPATIRDDIELACDDDDILAKGAAKRLGLDDDDVPFLQTLPMTQQDHIEYLFNAFRTMDLGGIEHPDGSDAPIRNAPPPPPTPGQPVAAIAGDMPIPPPPPPKPRRGGGRKAGGNVEGAVPKRTLELMKAHSARKDVDIAAAIGVSRATYNNYVLGKTAFNPEPEQAAIFRSLMVADANGLLEALALYDKTERIVVS